MEWKSTIPKMKLPMDFGLDKLYEENYNNMYFILQNGRKMGAAALMLAIHSPVLDQNYIKPGIKEIDVEEFRPETVVMFLEAMYNGILEVTDDNFGEMYKICSVFNVNWMLGRCTQFYRDSIDEADSVTVMILFEEAMRACETRKSDELLDIWRGALAAKEGPEANCTTYIKRYIEGDYDEVSEYTLSKLITVTDDHAMFVDLISNRVRGENVKVDKTSRFLLQNINLAMCMESCLDNVTEIFDVLLQDKDSPDFIMFNNLQRRISKAYIEKLKIERAVSTSTRNQAIPNIFTKFELGESSLLDNVAAKSCNMYMVLEYLDMCGVEITDAVLEKLQGFRRGRRWDPVNPEFLEGLQCNMSDESKSAVVTSTAHSIRVVCDKEPSIWEFLTTSATYKFKIEVPGQSASESEQESGILVQVTTGSNVNQTEFDMQLIVDKDKYPADFRYHGKPVSKIHLVLSVLGKEDGNTWCNCNISWLERPVYQDDGEVSWVTTVLTHEDPDPIRLVAYCSV